MSGVGALIRLRRQQAGITGASLARSIGFQGAALLSQIELNKQRLGVAKWWALARALGNVTVEELAAAAIGTGNVRIEVDMSGADVPVEFQRRGVAVLAMAANLLGELEDWRLSQ